MTDIWQVLVQFVFRLTFGVALSMAITPSSLVTSGFYRVHLWVLMGFNTFAALAAYSSREAFLENHVPATGVVGLAVALAAASYIGSVIWLYERQRVGGAVLFAIALLSLLAAALATPWERSTTGLGLGLAFLELFSSGLLLGVTMAAMLLGHWYLNTPTMALAPLKRLVGLMMVAVVIRTVLCAVGLAIHVAGEPLSDAFWLLIAFRWLAGLLGVLMMSLLAWYTLKVPNTQSATGILYAGVILTFIGELVSQLLSVDKMFPL